MKPTLMNRLLATTALATTLLMTAPAHAAGPSSVFIFGDSLSDTGNIGLLLGAPTGVPQVITGNTYIPGAPYLPNGTFSNGPVWATSFAAALGQSAIPALTPGGTNFAFGGARMATDGPGLPPSLSNQVTSFLGGTGGVAPSSALYVVAGGGNDLRDAASALAVPGLSFAQQLAIFSGAASRYATDVGAIVDRLQAAGASNIIVWNAPDVGLTPAARAFGPTAQFTSTTLATLMNDALSYRMQGEAGVTVFDVFGALNSIVANPFAYGLSNVTQACGFAGNLCSPATALFWDGIHPTAAGHQLLSNAMLAVVAIPEPETVWMFAIGLAGLLAWRRRRA
ncbi:MAG: SGNH/GDSL hydrolase family protein [Rubrivivax sp.]|nr:SGNH/GDSL hydrolase family protein [Rubrivivax sp.]MDP3084991.1 SGNH/GDSL hydrolase family protein [Rubrivivax sp.]